FLFGVSRCAIALVDIRGETLGTWHAAEYPRACDVPEGAISVPINAFHHELSVTSTGDFLVLSTEAREVDDFPTSEDDPEAPTTTEQVVGSVIVEFTREGEIVKSISILDLLDPTRIARDSLSTSWANAHVPSGETARD